MIRSVVRGFGTALPKRVLTNAELESMVDTSDDWIVQRTGFGKFLFERPDWAHLPGTARPRTSAVATPAE